MNDPQPRQPSTARIASFFIIAYLLSWTAWLLVFERHLSHLVGVGLWLYLAALVGPHISAAVNTASESGWAGVLNFYCQIFIRPITKWVVVGILVPPLVYLSRDAIAICFNLHHDSFFQRPPRTLPMLLIGQVIVVLGEEPGWRGYVLPVLVAKLGRIAGSIVLGAAWACWHLPLFLVPGTPQYEQAFVPFLILLISWSIVMTMIVSRARWNIVPAMLFHASANICAFTMWEPRSLVLNLAPWTVTAAVTLWLIPKRATQ